MDETFNFEQAFIRLEAILDQMNMGKVSLDASLNLYEEANSLIHKCESTLIKAEERIQTLVKDRQGKLVLNDNKPSVEDFELSANIS